MFRFTIRDLLWLMVVVGLGVGWYADRQRAGVQFAVLDEQMAVLQAKLNAWQDQHKQQHIFDQ
jgi:hypothetical protein